MSKDGQPHSKDAICLVKCPAAWEAHRRKYKLMNLDDDLCLFGDLECWRKSWAIRNTRSNYIPFLNRSFENMFENVRELSREKVEHS